MQAIEYGIERIGERRHVGELRVGRHDPVLNTDTVGELLNFGDLDGRLGTVPADGLGQREQPRGHGAAGRRPEHQPDLVGRDAGEAAVGIVEVQVEAVGGHGPVGADQLRLADHLADRHAVGERDGLKLASPGDVAGDVDADSRDPVLVAVVAGRDRDAGVVDGGRLDPVAQALRVGHELRAGRVALHEGQRRLQHADRRGAGQPEAEGDRVDPAGRGEVGLARRQVAVGRDMHPSGYVGGGHALRAQVDEFQRIVGVQQRGGGKLAQPDGRVVGARVVEADEHDLQFAKGGDQAFGHQEQLLPVDDRCQRVGRADRLLLAGNWHGAAEERRPVAPEVGQGQHVHVDASDRRQELELDLGRALVVDDHRAGVADRGEVFLHARHVEGRAHDGLAADHVLGRVEVPFLVVLVARQVAAVLHGLGDRLRIPEERRQPRPEVAPEDQALLRMEHVGAVRPVVEPRREAVDRGTRDLGSAQREVGQRRAAVRRHVVPDRPGVRLVEPALQQRDALGRAQADDEVVGLGGPQVGRAVEGEARPDHAVGSLLRQRGNQGRRDLHAERGAVGGIEEPAVPGVDHHVGQRRGQDSGADVELGLERGLVARDGNQHRRLDHAENIGLPVEQPDVVRAHRRAGTVLRLRAVVEDRRAEQVRPDAVGAAGVADENGHRAGSADRPGGIGDRELADARHVERGLAAPERADAKRVVMPGQRLLQPVGHINQHLGGTVGRRAAEIQLVVRRHKPGAVGGFRHRQPIEIADARAASALQRDLDPVRHMLDAGGVADGEPGRPVDAFADRHARTGKKVTGFVDVEGRIAFVMQHAVGELGQQEGRLVQDGAVAVVHVDLDLPGVRLRQDRDLVYLARRGGIPVFRVAEGAAVELGAGRGIDQAREQPGGTEVRQAPRVAQVDRVDRVVGRDEHLVAAVEALDRDGGADDALDGAQRIPAARDAPQVRDAGQDLDLRRPAARGPGARLDGHPQIRAVRQRLLDAHRIGFDAREACAGEAPLHVENHVRLVQQHPVDTRLQAQGGARGPVLGRAGIADQNPSAAALLIRHPESRGTHVAAQGIAISIERLQRDDGQPRRAPERQHAVVEDDVGAVGRRADGRDLSEFQPRQRPPRLEEGTLRIAVDREPVLGDGGRARPDQELDPRVAQRLGARVAQGDPGLLERVVVAAGHRGGQAARGIDRRPLDGETVDPVGLGVVDERVDPARVAPLVAVAVLGQDAEVGPARNRRRAPRFRLGIRDGLDPARTGRQPEDALADARGAGHRADAQVAVRQGRGITIGRRSAAEDDRSPEQVRLHPEEVAGIHERVRHLVEARAVQIADLQRLPADQHGAGPLEFADLAPQHDLDVRRHQRLHADVVERNDHLPAGIRHRDEAADHVGRAHPIHDRLRPDVPGRAYAQVERDGLLIDIHHHFLLRDGDPPHGDVAEDGPVILAQPPRHADPRHAIGAAAVVAGAAEHHGLPVDHAHPRAWRLVAVRQAGEEGPGFRLPAVGPGAPVDAIRRPEPQQPGDQPVGHAIGHRLEERRVEEAERAVLLHLHEGIEDGAERRRAEAGQRGRLGWLPERQDFRLEGAILDPAEAVVRACRQQVEVGAVVPGVDHPHGAVREDDGCGVGGADEAGGLRQQAIVRTAVCQTRARLAGPVESVGRGRAEDVGGRRVGPRAEVHAPVPVGQPGEVGRIDVAVRAGRRNAHPGFQQPGLAVGGRHAEDAAVGAVGAGVVHPVETAREGDDIGREAAGGIVGAIGRRRRDTSIGQPLDDAARGPVERSGQPLVAGGQHGVQHIHGAVAVQVGFRGRGKELVHHRGHVVRVDAVVGRGIPAGQQHVRQPQGAGRPRHQPRLDRGKVAGAAGGGRHPAGGRLQQEIARRAGIGGVGQAVPAPGGHLRAAVGAPSIEADNAHKRGGRRVGDHGAELTIEFTDGPATTLRGRGKGDGVHVPRRGRIRRRGPGFAAIGGLQDDAIASAGPPLGKGEHLDIQQVIAGGSLVLQRPVRPPVRGAPDPLVLADRPSVGGIDEIQTVDAHRDPAIDGCPVLAIRRVQQGAVARDPTARRRDEIDGVESRAGAAGLRHPGRAAIGGRQHLAQVARRVAAAGGDKPDRLHGLARRIVLLHPGGAAVGRGVDQVAGRPSVRYAPEIDSLEGIGATGPAVPRPTAVRGAEDGAGRADRPPVAGIRKGDIVEGRNFRALFLNHPSCKADLDKSGRRERQEGRETTTAKAIAAEQIRIHPLPPFAAPVAPSLPPKPGTKGNLPLTGININLRTIHSIMQGMARGKVDDAVIG